MADNTNENSALLSAAIPAAHANGYGTQNVSLESETTTMSSMPNSGNKSKKWPQYCAALAATGGALAAGTILGWTSPAESQLIVKNDDYGFTPITPEDFSWVGASLTLGAAAVCIPIGMLINILGRRLTMLLLVIPFTIGWILLIWAQNLAMMIVGRIILGISGGAFCVTAPLYTGEIAENDIRGSLGSYFQLMVTVGILFVYAVGAGVNVFWLSIICGIIPLIFGAIFFFMPETPLYLVSKGREEDAVKSLQFLRGNQYDCSSELSELQVEHNKRASQNISTRAAFKRKSTIRGMIIAMGLMFFQQMSGINAVIFYTNQIFGAANSGLSSEVATIIVGVVQVIATFVSSLIVDKLGRRILLLASDSIMAVCTILLGIYFYLDQNGEDVSNLGWLPIVSLCMFIVMFSLGFGPIPWMMMGELFAADIKGLAGSLAGTFNWLLAFIVTKTFTNLVLAMGRGETFWLFSALSIVGTAFVFFVVPETKGKSLAEIQRMLGADEDIQPTTEEDDKK